MKNFTWALLGLLLFTPYLPAEVIDTVTFNPARLGQYERLKVSDGLTSHGGVEAQSMAVQSNGEVTVSNEGNYHLPQAQINGSLHMPSTRFETPKLSSRGGTAYFDETAGTDVQSHIDTLTQTALRVKANVLEAGEAKVNGVASSGYDGNSIQGLKLGGNDIPKGEGCSGLDWVERTDAQGNTYKMLGMRTCGSGDTQCTASYGAAQNTKVVGKQDTCPDHNPYTSYTCPSDGSFTGTCIDVMNVFTDFNRTGAEMSAPDSQADTCDGDRNRKYAASPSRCPAASCIDVYTGGGYKASVTGKTEWHWYCTPAMSSNLPLESTSNSVTLFNQNLNTSDSTLKSLCGTYMNSSTFYIYLTDRSKPVCSNDLFGTIYYETYRMVKCEMPYLYSNGTCTEDTTFREVNCCANK